MRGRCALGPAVVGLLVWLTAPALAVEINSDIAKWYSDVSLYPPTAEEMTVCYGFVCRRRMTLGFTAADRKKVTEIMAGGRASPEAERKAVQQAVIWFERRVGPIIGTDKRIARADFRHFAAATNFDCHDTTRNGTSLLLVLSHWGLLRHHVVNTPRYRGNLLVGQTPHNTPILTEKVSRQDWVVDMWTKAYAEPPDVMTLEQWMKED
jgi:hypothetical protein